MAKDYIILLIEWCSLKITLAFKHTPAVFKQGEIWWCSIGMNIGEEIYGKGPLYARPVLVFKKLTTNSFLGLPLTSQVKDGSWYIKVTIHGKTSRVMLNQARTFDRKRIISRMGTLDDPDFKNVQVRFIDFYRLENYSPRPDKSRNGDQWGISQM